EADAGAVVLVDSLGPWVGAQLEDRIDIGALLATLQARVAPVVLVSDEVGLGVHPSTELGRRFRDALGELNRAIAEVADEVLLVVAGRVLPLERP
ncbi:MAG: adenosylcobinamide kinase / adenosylcobinamide-phosphate guanylyltransferase, partial [Acidimicrobiaceae bacterium]